MADAYVQASCEDDEQVVVNLDLEGGTWDAPPTLTIYGESTGAVSGAANDVLTMVSGTAGLTTLYVVTGDIGGVAKRFVASLSVNPATAPPEPLKGDPEPP